MTLIGRSKEQNEIRGFLGSGKAEFVVVYGRRRVGKTYLVSEFFHDRFSFHATGLSAGRMAEQLSAFDVKLAEYGLEIDGPSKSWIEAFTRLKALLSRSNVTRDGEHGRRIVFIDEMPWFDTPKSGFKAALEFFWNDWASRQSDLMLIVCGSATSWVAKNLLESKGGFYNRVTRIMDLQPLTPNECRNFFESKGITFTPEQLVECSMIFGGIPFYLDLLDRSKSLAQNVDDLCFGGGQLHREFERVFSTLFKHPEAYMKVVRALSGKRAGMTRKDLRKIRGFEGSRLTTVLDDLEKCGFVRRYRDFAKHTRDSLYQLVDPFTLFHLRFIEPGRIDSWVKYVGSPGYNAWCGIAFEMFCLNNIELIKGALGISGIQTGVCAWRSKEHNPGAQIDLLIDRADNVVNVCEMKFSRSEFSINAGYERDLRNKVEAFEQETNPRKALHLTMITMNGVKRNAHSDSIVQNEVRIADLIRRYRP